MKAYYYRIRHYNKASALIGAIVDEGIITNSEDNIYPGQNSPGLGLPFECECHHFSHSDFILDGWDIEITREFCENQKRAYSTL